MRAKVISLPGTPTPVAICPAEILQKLISGPQITGGGRHTKHFLLGCHCTKGLQLQYLDGPYYLISLIPLSEILTLTRYSLLAE